MLNPDDENAKNYLEKMLAILDIEATVQEEPMDETTSCLRIECRANDAKILIGRKGQTLEALQFLLRQMVRGGRIEHGHFVVDVLNYRVRRKEAIMEQAKEGAVAVLNGESEEYELAPMTAFERRVVHQYLQDNFPELASNSKGHGPDRRIIISYVGLAEGADSTSKNIESDNGHDADLVMDESEESVEES
jgi:spoIIIJ-associated protein